MNILYTIRDLHIGGTGNVLLQNVSLLSPIHNINLVYFGNNSKMNNRFSEYGVVPIHIEYRGLQDIIKASKELRAIIKEKEIDVIHSNLFLDKVIVPLACTGLEIKKVSTLHAAVDSTKDLSFKKLISIKFVYFLLNHFYHSVTAVSQAAKISAEELGGLKKDKAKVIYTGVKPLSKFQDVKSIFPEGSIVIGTSCRFDPVKGLIRLLNVFKKLNENIPNCCLLIIGDGEERANVEAQIRKLKLEEKVILTGYTDQVSLYLNQLEFYINSSYSEALGLGTIEALSLSKPIIASNVGGLREYIKDDYNGTLIDFVNEDEAYKKIKNFLKYADENYKELSRNAKKTYDEKFGIEKYKELLLNIYN